MNNKIDIGYRWTVIGKRTYCKHLVSSLVNTISFEKKIICSIYKQSFVIVARLTVYGHDTLLACFNHLGVDRFIQSNFTSYI